MKRGAPAGPDDLPPAQKREIPPFVFDVVNKLLAEAEDREFIKLELYLVKQSILSNMPTDEGPFHADWLDFEQAYRDAGWKVIYDRPPWNEDYDACYLFEPLKKMRKE